MPSVRIIKEEKDCPYFITLTVKNWYRFFDRFDRFKILEKSFEYCQKSKGLKIYAFVFMINHLHFIGQADDMGVVLRDMKTFLSKEFKNNIFAFEPKVLEIFEENGKYTFWEKTNYPKQITSKEFLKQKINYIHENPLKKGYVNYAEDWKWSSANKVPTKIKITPIDV